MSKNLPQKYTQAIGTAIVLYDYKAQQADELSLFEGTKVFLFERSRDGWWRGQSGSAIGWFPGNYIGDIQDSHGRSFHYAMSNQLPSTVVAMYDFKATDAFTLSFKKGDIFEVICRPSSDPGWYKVRNEKGLLGLVPLNYVKYVDKNYSSGESGYSHSGVSGDSRAGGDGPNIEGPYRTLIGIELKPKSSASLSTLSVVNQYQMEKPYLAGKPWYYGAIKRAQSETLLNQHGEYGDFIIRDSETFKNDYAISLRTPNRNKHFHVRVEHNAFSVGQRKFATLDDVIYYYQRYPICTTDSGEKMCLVRPLSEAENSLMTLQSYY